MGGHRGVSPGFSAAARSPEFRGRHASSGQVTVWTVVVTSEPTEPAAANRQIAGVAEGETSLQRRPARPTTITGRPAGCTVAARSSPLAGAPGVASSTATRPAIAAAIRPARLSFTYLKYPPWPCSGRPE